VVGRWVDWMQRVKRRARGFRGEIILHIRLVVGDEMRPSEVARLPRLVYLVEAGRATAWTWHSRIGPHFAPVKQAAVPINGNAEWVATAHHVDLWTRAGCARWEQVPWRDRVGAVRLRVDPIDFAAQVIGVGRGFLRVPGRAPRPRVDGSVT